MIAATAHPAHGGGWIIDPIRMGVAQPLGHDVIPPYLLRIALRAPCRAILFAIPHEFLCLGVYRDDRLSPALQRLPPAVKISDLGVPRWRRGAFFGFVMALAAIPQVIQHSGHGLVAEAIALRGQGGGQWTRTPTGPPERTFWITPRRR